MFKLQGAFFVLGAAGGRWPEVHIIWDVPNGWDGWASNADRLNLKRRKAFYGDWWEPRPSGARAVTTACASVRPDRRRPTRSRRGYQRQLVRRRDVGSHPARKPTFLDAVREQKVPIMEDYGHRLTGLYEVSNNRHEVIVVWATSIAARTAFHKARYTYARLVRRRHGRRSHREVGQDGAHLGDRGQERHMTPLPRTVYGPDDGKTPRSRCG